MQQLCSNELQAWLQDAKETWFILFTSTACKAKQISANCTLLLATLDCIWCILRLQWSNYLEKTASTKQNLHTIWFLQRLQAHTRLQKATMTVKWSHYWSNKLHLAEHAKVCFLRALLHHCLGMGIAAKIRLHTTAWLLGYGFELCSKNMFCNHLIPYNYIIYIIYNTPCKTMDIIILHTYVFKEMVASNDFKQLQMASVPLQTLQTSSKNCTSIDLNVYIYWWHCKLKCRSCSHLHCYKLKNDFKQASCCLYLCSCVLSQNYNVSS